MIDFINVVIKMSFIPPHLLSKELQRTTDPKRRESLQKTLDLTVEHMQQVNEWSKQNAETPLDNLSKEELKK